MRYGSGSRGGTLGGSPVATRPEDVFGDPGAVAARVRARLEEELESPEFPEVTGFDEATGADGEPPPRIAPAVEVARFAREERARVLEAGVSGLEKLAAGRADAIDEDEYVGVAAIVLLEGRPAIPVRGRDFAPPPETWAVLDSERAAIGASLAAVGRVVVGGHPSLDWIGTAFLAGPEVVLTTRRVAAEFCRADDMGWAFRPGMTARLAPGEKLPAHPAPGPVAAAEQLPYEITGVIGVHPDADLALLRLAPPTGEPRPDPLAIAADAPADLPGRAVYVIGYPAGDGRRDEPETMRRIFMDAYDLKRLQPGRATGFSPGALELWHDCSTLGDNGGAPVVDLADHRVLGLHTGGRYRVGNVAVPLWELMDDPLLARAEVNWV
ncbi:serine protease [Streptomyces sp. NPDC048717]|uniref:trypsin-like serine peptidase n=1 Tax=Streptomyces sp. NPDC048717 TaxID=3154928 RepID=UPI00343F4992